MSQQFDELAALYEKMAEWPFRKYCEIPSTIEALGDISGLSILDFGCGSVNRPGYFRHPLGS
ncbi:hypothetical protein J4377_07165 [Halomonas sp. XH26]|uniref:hypothetical protein n=1 Tax=Halomonas sp. XH26 TaxID=2557993 RepID=UPI0020A0D8C7|nr:hypothetical protein [Halomonas sp. XH26]UTA81239.1 hypothetical protein J4377_07165 [Halomonas sp. XH26]